jgi:3-hydroxyacyl-[acyl-carrier-protein] dehydratase
VVDPELNKAILALIPQKHPFRFIDTILDLDETSITASYRFHQNEFFFQGHFPGNPITPGVILIEAMAQTGVVAFGISRLLSQGKSPEEVNQMTTLFAFADEVEFSGMVSPDQNIVIQGEMIYFRRGSLKSKVWIEHDNGEKICSGTLTGSGVKLHGR